MAHPPIAPRRRTLAGGAALAAILSASTPSLAADPPDPTAAINAQTALITAENARISAETARITAETEKMKAQSAALGLPSAKGETTLGEGAGQMEATMLSGAAMNVAAEAIASLVPAGRDVIVIGPAETFDLSLPVILTEQMKLVSGDARQLAKAACPPAAAKPKAAWLMEIAPLLGAVVSALKVDTEIRGVTVATQDRSMINAVAGAIGARAIVPSEAVLPGDFAATRVGAAWSELRAARQQLFECRTTITGDKRKAEAAKLDASLAEIDTLTRELTKSEGGAASALIRASQIETLSGSGAAVLRVSADYAGGSLLKRTNLWTAFGATGVSLTGGLVASYRLTEPATGKVLKAGLLICRTAHTNLRAVQDGKVGAGGCSKAVRNA